MTCARLTACLVLFLHVAVGTARHAVAEDPPKAPTFVELKVAYELARKAKDWDEVGNLLPKLAAAATEGKVEAEIKEALSILNRHLTHGSPGLQTCALAGFGILAKPTSSQYLRSFVDGDKAGKRPIGVRKAALEAWARIHDPGTHSVLLDYLHVSTMKDEDRDMAVHAAKQYAHYKGVPKRSRFEIIRDFMQSYHRIYDQTTLFVSASAQSWWGLLNAPMLATFNELTDTQQSSFEACVLWWRENKGKVQAARE